MRMKAQGICDMFRHKFNFQSNIYALSIVSSYQIAMHFLDICRWQWPRIIHRFLLMKDIEMVIHISILLFFFTFMCHLFFSFMFFSWHILPGKVQVALVWNSRNENSHNSAQLNALSNVRTSTCTVSSYFWLLLLFIHLRLIVGLILNGVS